MSSHFYNPVGKCIYCGTASLPEGTSRFEDEHIIPFAFGGALILPQSSCRKCSRKINSEIETPVLDHEWGALRARYGLPTRDPKRRRKRLETPLELPTMDGATFKALLKDYSTPIPLYIFGTPRILTGLSRDAPGQTWSVQILSDHIKELEMQMKFPHWNRAHTLKVKASSYARFLAKIAHGFAIADYGNSTVSAFTPLLPDIILGASGDVFYAVGGDPVIPAAATSGENHNLDLHLLPLAGRLFLVISIRLFARIKTPSYSVVAGEIFLNNQDHVAMLKKHQLDGKIEKFSF